MKLPKYICPIKKTDLVRLGRNNDGGYAVTKKSIDKTQSLISFGISDDWSFEQSFKLKKDIKIICFDNSVNLAFWLRRFIRDTIDLFLFRNNALNILKDFLLILIIYLFF